MKKVGFTLIILVVVMVVSFIFVKQSYHPPLPIEYVTAKEAVEKLEAADRNIVEMAVEDDTIWYITRSHNKGISIADENIKQMIGSNGWEFKEKEGAGLFFEKDGERLIATTQMWSRDYVLVKVQSHFRNMNLLLGVGNIY